MKILHIAGGGDRGGAKTHILALCARLSQVCDLKLVSLRSGEFSDEAAEAGIDTTTIYSRFVPADYLHLLRLVRREKPDLVHCHGAKANIAGALIKLFCGRTILTTVHSDYRLDYLHSALKRLTIGKLNGAALRKFDYYVTVSDQFKSMLIERGFPPQRCMTIYNGLDFSQKAPPIDRTEYLRSLGLDYEDGDVVLGIPARLNPVKDIPTLLRAFAKARAKNPRIRLLIGGDGEEMGHLQALAKELKLGKSICFCGWVKDVPRFFSACDIDVLCSISESFPYSVLEGIREGCAVITSDVGGMRRLIDHGESGYIFQPRDADTFAAYILDLSLDGEKRRLFAHRLYEKASLLYSMDAMAHTQENIYRTVLEMERRHGARDGVLICGAYGRGNSGDEAILRAILRSMRNIDPLVPLTVMTRRPAQTRLLHGVDAIYTFNLPLFLRAARRSRLFINGGGSLIQDSTSSRSLYFYLYSIWAAHRRGCRVLMYGCGIGHVHRPFNRRLARSILNRNVDIITLRDQVSRDELRAMGISKPDIRAAADPAFSLPPASAEEAEEYLRAQGVPEGDCFCISIRRWKDFDRFPIFAEAADYAAKKYGLHTVFMPIEQPTDLPPSLTAAQRMETPYTIVQTPENVPLAIAVLGRMRLACAMRLHALVFAAAADAPFIAVSYDIKVQSFMNYIGSDACCGLDDLTVPWLCAQIDRMMCMPRKMEFSPRLRALEQENSRAAREMLESGHLS